MVIKEGLEKFSESVEKVVVKWLNLFLHWYKSQFFNIIKKGEDYIIIGERQITAFNESFFVANIFFPKKYWFSYYFSEKPASPLSSWPFVLELLDKLERKESPLSELWTLELPLEASFELRLERELLREAEDTGLVGGSVITWGAWTSTLNAKLAVTLVTCWAVGVEHREELRLLAWKENCYFTLNDFQAIFSNLPRDEW